MFEGGGGGAWPGSAIRKRILVFVKNQLSVGVSDTSWDVFIVFSLGNQQIGIERRRHRPTHQRLWPHSESSDTSANTQTGCDCLSTQLMQRRPLIREMIEGFFRKATGFFCGCLVKFPPRVCDGFFFLIRGVSRAMQYFVSSSV